MLGKKGPFHCSDFFLEFCSLIIIMMCEVMSPIHDGQDRKMIYCLGELYAGKKYADNRELSLRM